LFTGLAFEPAPRARFEYELQDHLSEADAESTLRGVTGWDRHAELFAYDDQSRSLRLSSQHSFEPSS
jgi:NitT/TauT family transport system ATP-binding protein